MKCKKCNKEMGTGESSIEYCDGYCANCYDGTESLPCGCNKSLGLLCSEHSDSFCQEIFN